VRIVAGRFRNRRLHGPTWEGLRPTSDKLRETLFNIVAGRIEGARVLDGYAGTGAVGAEALSRGASHVTFVEADPRAIALIRRNLAFPGIEGRYTIQRGEVGAVLRRGATAEPFDIVFLDPPYDEPPAPGVLDDAARHLGPDGLIVLERSSRRDPHVPPSLDRVRDVTSGDSALTFLARRAGPGDAPEQR
jgi:16S rRNA (guanine(966)-N(2))-methyltransferase RsmD